jgi:SlyX protein
MSDTPRSLDDRVVELESRLAFQDDLVERLNEVIARQDRELERLAQRLKVLELRLAEVAEATAAAGPAPGHEVPPHY